MNPKMNLKTAYEECRYSTLNDFRALAFALGYKEEYNNKTFLFTRDDGDYRFDEKLLRSRWSRITASEKEHQEAFLRSVCESISYDRIKESIEPRGFQLIERDNGDRFIFSPEDKCIVSLGRVVHFSMEEGYALDGTGRKLENEEFTPLREVDSRYMKASRQEDKVVIYYKSEGDPFEVSFFRTLPESVQAEIKEGKSVDVEFEGRICHAHLDKDLNRLLVIPYSQDRLFKLAINKEDWGHIQRLKDSGYKPSPEIMKELRISSPKQAAAVGAIFSISDKKEEKKKEVDLKQPSSPHHRKEQTRNSCDLVRTMFTDL